MRRGKLWWTIALFVLATVQSLALQARPHPPFPGFRHPPKAEPPPQGTQEPAIVDATSLGSPLVLDKGWRVGITADPAAATPGFDDSGWAIRDASGTIADVREPDDNAEHPDHEDKFAWFRLHVKLAPNHGPVALLVELPVTQSSPLNINNTGPGTDVFANGKLVLPDGPHPDDTGDYQQISRIYELNVPPSETSVTLAVRTLYFPFGLKGYTNFFFNRKFELGPPHELEESLSLWSVRTLFERLPRLVIAILLLFLSVFLLTLYFTQKGHPEYLWLALHELVQVPISIIDQASSSALLDNIWSGGLYLQLVFISAYLYFEFLVAFLALKRRWYIKALRYTAPILALIAPTILLVGHNKAVTIALVVVLLSAIFWVIGWAIFVFLTLIIATIKRNFEAGLLLIPLVLTMVGIVEPILTGGMGRDWRRQPTNLR